MKSFAWLRARPRALASAAVVTAVALTVGYFAYAYEGEPIPGLGVVPVLDTYTFSTERTEKVLKELAATGSQAAPGFMRPEGIVVFHSQSRSVYKALLENDHLPKGQVE